MLITRATAADAAVIAPLFDAYRVFYTQASDVKSAEAFLWERLTLGQSVVFVSRVGVGVGAEVVGFAQLYPSFTSVGLRPILVLNDLFVAAEHRRGGHGRALIAECVAEGRRRGCRNLVLLTEYTNVTAKALYERLGWVIDTTYARYTFRLDA